MSPNRDIPWCNEHRTVGCRYSIGRPGTTYLFTQQMVTRPQYVYPKFTGGGGGGGGGLLGVRVWYVNRNYAGA